MCDFITKSCENYIVKNMRLGPTQFKPIKLSMQIIIWLLSVTIGLIPSSRDPQQPMRLMLLPWSKHRVRRAEWRRPGPTKWRSGASRKGQCRCPIRQLKKQNKKINKWNDSAFCIFDSTEKCRSWEIWDCIILTVNDCFIEIISLKSAASFITFIETKDIFNYTVEYLYLEVN